MQDRRLSVDRVAAQKKILEMEVFLSFDPKIKANGLSIYTGESVLISIDEIVRYCETHYKKPRDAVLSTLARYVHVVLDLERDTPHFKAGKYECVDAVDVSAICAAVQKHRFWPADGPRYSNAKTLIERGVFSATEFPPVRIGVNVFQLEPGHVAYTRDSPSYGVMTTRAVPKNDCIGFYAGVYLPDMAIPFDPYVMASEVDGMICTAWSRGNETRYINDYRGIAPEPNCAANKAHYASGDALAIFALRNIEPGEELLLDYGDDYWVAVLNTSTERWNAGDVAEIDADVAEVEHGILLTEHGVVCGAFCPCVVTELAGDRAQVTVVHNGRSAVVPTAALCRPARPESVVYERGQCVDALDGTRRAEMWWKARFLRYACDHEAHHVPSCACEVEFFHIYDSGTGVLSTVLDRIRHASYEYPFGTAPPQETNAREERARKRKKRPASAQIHADRRKRRRDFRNTDNTKLNIVAHVLKTLHTATLEKIVNYINDPANDAFFYDCHQLDLGAIRPVDVNKVRSGIRHAKKNAHHAGMISHNGDINTYSYKK